MKRITCKCGSTTAICPECGQEYKHSRHPKTAHCSKPACRKVNAPLDCTGCGFVVSNDGKGVLDFDMKLIPWRE